MKRPISRLLAAAAALLVLAAAAPLSRAQTPRKPALAIGLSGPLSGPLADAGKAMAAGAALAVKDINASGGFNGAQATLVIENDEAGSVQARRAAEALAAREVRIVVGHHTSAPTSAAAEIYARNGILLLAPSATSPAIPASGKARFLRLAPREEMQGFFAGRLLATDHPAGEIYVVHDGAAQSRALANAALRAVQQTRKQSAQIKLTSAGADAPQQAALLARTIAGEKPAAIYLASGPATAAAFLKALRQTGADVPVLSSEALATPEFAAAAGDALDGLRTVLPAPPPAPSKDIAAKLNAEGVRDAPLALAVYAAVQVVAEAARRAKSLEPAQLERAMRDAPATATVIGEVGFDAQGERRELPFAVVRWTRATDGKFVFAPE